MPGLVVPRLVSPRLAPADAYAEAILATPGLEHYWRMGDVVRDETGRVGDGTYRSSVVPNQAGIDGLRDPAARMSGANAVNGTVIPLRAGAPLALPLTLEAWVNLDPSASAFNHHPVISISVGANVAGGNRVAMIARRGSTAGNKFAFWDGVRGWVESSVTLTLGAWHHLVWGRGRTSHAGYVDGQLVAATPVTDTAIGGMDDLQMGMSLWSDTETLKGLIDEVAVYSRILDAAEVRHHYEAGAI